MSDDTPCGHAPEEHSLQHIGMLRAAWAAIVETLEPDDENPAIDLDHVCADCLLRAVLDVTAAMVLRHDIDLAEVVQDEIATVAAQPEVDRACTRLHDLLKDRTDTNHYGIVLEDTLSGVDYVWSTCLDATNDICVVAVVFGGQPVEDVTSYTLVRGDDVLAELTEDEYMEALLNPAPLLAQHAQKEHA